MTEIESFLLRNQINKPRTVRLTGKKVLHAYSHLSWKESWWTKVIIDEIFFCWFVLLQFGFVSADASLGAEQFGQIILLSGNSKKLFNTETNQTSISQENLAWIL